MTDTLQYALLLPIIVGIFVGPTAGYLGSIMISKRMALVGDALSHVALPGLAIGLLLNFNPFIGAFTFLVAVMIATWYLQKSTVLPIETIIGVLFVLALAVGLLITPETELLHALFGDISTITPLDTAITGVIALFTVLVTRLIYRDMAMSMISKEMALSMGVKVERINLIYLILVATVVAIGIKEVGTILVGAVVIVPAAAARNISRNLRNYALFSAFFGGFSAVIGVVISYFSGVPAGPLVVISGVVVFVIAFFIGKGHWR
ncbi:MAG TPA: metal ABC transporter permease [Thermoplasmataceae archaeon]|nr:metal ABC transporter permease [Thermoplasmataceae archaeon]